MPPGAKDAVERAALKRGCARIRHRPWRGGAAFGCDQGHRALRKREIPVNDQDRGARAGEQDAGGAAVADTLALGAAAGDNGDAAGQAHIVAHGHPAPGMLTRTAWMPPSRLVAWPGPLAELEQT